MRVCVRANWMQSYFQVKWRATLVTLAGSQTHIVEYHLPMGTQEAFVLVCVLLADMINGHVGSISGSIQ